MELRLHTDVVFAGCQAAEPVFAAVVCGPCYQSLPLEAFRNNLRARIPPSPKPRQTAWMSHGEDGIHFGRVVDEYIDIRDQCVKAGVAFFFKQWGGVQKKKTGRASWKCRPGSNAGVRGHFLMPRLVVHCKKEKYDVYIGRAVPRSGLKASVWGNPFVIGKDGTREELMVKYRAWLLANPEALEKLPELKGKVLGCWCAPEACHGDILSEPNSSFGGSPQTLASLSNWWRWLSVYPITT